MLLGYSIVNGEPTKGAGATFNGFDPATGARLEPPFHSASDEDVDLAANLAGEAMLASSEHEFRDQSLVFSCGSFHKA